MRQLTTPRVLESALIAAVATALACYPRLMLWQQPLPVWVLETAILLCAIILWSFVFAWHTHHTGRPVFVLRPAPRLIAIATAIGLCGAAGLHWLIDPTLRAVSPADYPAGLWQWAAFALWYLAFNQLFLVFAPFAWWVRLTGNPARSAGLTICVAVGLLVLKAQALEALVSNTFLLSLLALRVVFGVALVLVYLRGGVVLAWWCGLLVEARHLIDLPGGP